jgi:chromosome segregation ATPase
MSEELQQGLYDLCLLLYTQLSAFESQEGPTLEELLSYSLSESLAYARLKVQELIQYRQEFSEFPASYDLSTIQQFEKALQKSENDIRNHIKIEQQLRLHIESLQSKLDEEQKSTEDKIAHLKQIIDQLKSEKGGRQRRHAMMDIGEIKGKGGCFTERREEKDLERKELEHYLYSSKLDSERVNELIRRITKLEHQVYKYKSAYYARDQAYRDISQKLAAVRSCKHTDFKPRHTLKKDQIDLEHSTSRGTCKRAFTPIPSTTKSPIQPLAHSNSAKRTRPKSRLKPHETDTFRE